MTEEPYRWLEAIQNRREYIEDQLRSASPVVAISGQPGILLMAARVGTPKIFEIYDHLALGCLGHPADMEKIRQAAIDTAHVEGFTRSPQDVSSRRLVNYALAPALKNAFEQIFTGPLMVRSILAEIGATPSDDQAWLLEYDGTFRVAEPSEFRRGSLIAGPSAHTSRWDAVPKPTSADPLNSWSDLALAALRVLALTRDVTEDEPIAIWNRLPNEFSELLAQLPAEKLEIVILERNQLHSGITFRPTTIDQLKQL